MDELKRRISAEGVHLGNGILKVDSFLNHQVDTGFLFKMGAELARHFRTSRVSKVLTAESSGIAPALAVAHALGVPLVFARKTRPVTMTGAVYSASTPSHTKGGNATLTVEAAFLGRDERVLIVDDFLARGDTLKALVSLTEQAGATCVGVGVVVEKEYEKGRDCISEPDVPIVALATVRELKGNEIVLEP